MMKYRQIGNKVYKLVGKCEPEKCGTWCCHHIVLKIPKVNPNDVEYFEARGIRVRELGDRELALLITAPCQHITKDGKCGIYNERFENCVIYAKRKTDWFSSPECNIMWKEIHGREAQIALKRMRDR